MNNIRYMYIRNANYEPIGCVAIHLVRSKNRAEYGLSMRNPKDAMDSSNRRIPFNRQMAQSLALANLVKEQKRTFVFADATMHEVSTAVFKDIVANGHSPSGAVRFAKRWLKTTEMLHDNFWMSLN